MTVWDDLIEFFFELFGELYCALLDDVMSRWGRKGGRLARGLVKAFSVLMLFSLVVGVLLLCDGTYPLLGTVLCALGALYVLVTLILALIKKK